MSEDLVPVKGGGEPLYADDLVRYLRQSRQLSTVTRDAMVSRVVTTAARAAEVAVTDAELQRAADLFRYGHGLTSEEATRRWLVGQFLTVEDWEAGLEQDLLTEKFKDHLMATKGEAFLVAHRDAFARVRLRRLTVATDGLAREVLAQVREEGRPFAEVAAARTADPAAGDLGEVFRRHMPAAVADAVFAAAPGDVVGPFPTPHGHELYQVGDQRPAEFDTTTAAVIRDEVFAAWVRDRMAGVTITLEGFPTA